MKRYGMVAGAAIMLAACGSNTTPTPTPTTPPNTIVFNATLNAANEVPPITNAEANGKGTATITFNLTRDASGAITAGTANFVYSLNTFPAGSTVTLSHIHNAPAGQTASPFINTGQTAANGITIAGDGSVTNVTFSNIAMTAAQAQAVIDNPAGHYFNVHTTLNGGGAARGQLVRQ